MQSQEDQKQNSAITVASFPVSTPQFFLCAEKSWGVETGNKATIAEQFSKNLKVQCLPYMEHRQAVPHPHLFPGLLICPQVLWRGQLSLAPQVQPGHPETAEAFRLTTHLLEEGLGLRGGERERGGRGRERGERGGGRRRERGGRGRGGFRVLSTGFQQGTE